MERRNFFKACAAIFGMALIGVTRHPVIEPSAEPNVAYTIVEYTDCEMDPCGTHWDFLPLYRIADA